MKHVLDITDLSIEEIDSLIATAMDIIKDKEKYQDICKRKKLATLFFEPSTRTRLRPLRLTHTALSRTMQVEMLR